MGRPPGRTGRGLSGRLIREPIVTGALLSAMAIGGAVAWRHGLSIPPWTDAQAAARLYAQACDIEGDQQANWYAAREAFRTARWLFVDGGRSLLLAALTLGGLRLYAFRDWTKPRTPGSKAGFFVLGSVAVAGFFYGLVRMFEIEQRREMFAPCADTILIPIVGAMTLAIVVYPILLLVGLVVSRGFGPLPASLLAWRADRPRRSWAWTIVTGFAMLPLFAGLAVSIASSNFLVVPSCIIGVYLLAATRGALLSASVGKS